MSNLLFLFFETEIVVQTWNNTMVAGLSSAITTILAIITAISVWYITKRRGDTATANKTDADAGKVKADTVGVVIDKLLIVTAKFEAAQENYFILKNNYGELYREYEEAKDKWEASEKEQNQSMENLRSNCMDMKGEFQELILITESLLISETDPKYDIVKTQLSKLKQRFFATGD